MDFLFIKNVGNLVCPSSYDLGEDLRLVLLSVTEGEDKPLKYPTIFNTADVAVITKADLAEAVEFDSETARRNTKAVRPGMQVFEVSTKAGEGIAAWRRFLGARKATLQAEVFPNGNLLEALITPVSKQKKRAGDDLLPSFTIELSW